MSCNCNNKNQTHKDVFEFLRSQGLHVNGAYKDSPGIGAFIIPAPEKGILETSVVYVDDLTYRECFARGIDCLAYQWTPKGMIIKLATGETATINTARELQNIPSTCSGDPCHGRGCSFPCFCLGERDFFCHP